MVGEQQRSSSIARVVVWAIGAVIGVVVGVVTSDVVLGVAAGASFIAVAIGLMRLWTGGGAPRPHHP